MRYLIIINLKLKFIYLFKKKSDFKYLLFYLESIYVCLE